MIARMTGKAPLLLASFLFGIGVTGLMITTAERAEWGPFQPQTRTPEPRVVVVQVGPEITPPPLLELMNGGAIAVDASAQVQAPPVEAPAPPEPTPTPVPPLRVYGIASDDAGVSAAGNTPAPPPPIRVINVASDVEPDPTPTETTPPDDPSREQAEPQPQTGCPAEPAPGCDSGEATGEGAGAPALLAGNSGREIPGNAYGLQRRAEDTATSSANATPGNRGRAGH